MPQKNPYGVQGLQRRDGWWLFEWNYTDPTTGQNHRIRRVPDRSLTDAEVKQWARRVKAGVLTGRLNPKRAAAPRFAKVLQRYLEYCRRDCENTPSTLRRKRIQAGVLLEHFGDCALEHLDAPAVTQFRASLREAGRSKATANRYLAFLKHMVRWCIELGWMTEPQVAAIRRIRQTKEPRGTPRCLSPTEERSLLAAADPDIRPVLIVALDTGLRKGELVGLEWPAVDLERRRVVVGPSKNHEGRTLRLTDRAWHTLKRLESRSGPVFLAWDGEPYDAERLRKPFEAAKRRAGIQCRFHDLRSTFATVMAESGATVYQIKEALGHKTLEMSIRYVRATGRSVDPAIEAMERHRNGGEPDDADD